MESRVGMRKSVLGLKNNLTVETTVKFGHFGNLRLDRSRLCVDILQIKIVIRAVLLVLLGRTGTALLSCKGLLVEGHDVKRRRSRGQIAERGVHNSNM